MAYLFTIGCHLNAMCEEAKRIRSVELKGIGGETVGGAALPAYWTIQMGMGVEVLSAA